MKKKLGFFLTLETSSKKVKGYKREKKKKKVKGCFCKIRKTGLGEEVIKAKSWSLMGGGDLSCLYVLLFPSIFLYNIHESYTMISD